MGKNHSHIEYGKALAAILFPSQLAFSCAPKDTCRCLGVGMFCQLFCTLECCLHSMQCSIKLVLVWGFCSSRLLSSCQLAFGKLVFGITLEISQKHQFKHPQHCLFGSSTA